MKKERDLSIDLIRGLAGFLVITCHAALNNGFYDIPLVGNKMLLMAAIRMLSITCVPLFIILTGYLCWKRTLSKRYYFGIVRVVGTYLICAAICLVVRVFVLHEATAIKTAIKLVLNYTAAPYAWYIEMYLGLFFLIPFLNVLYRALEGRREKEILILTLFALSSLPAIVNVLGQILPQWWLKLYPLFYYFLGAYLAEYRPRLRWRIGVPLLLAATAVGALACYYVSGGGRFVWGDFNALQGGTVVISALVIFLLLQNIPLDGLPDWCKRAITRTAELSLGVYLVSWCFDSIFYPILAERVVDIPSRIWYYPIIIPAVYLCSLATAQLVEWVQNAIEGGVQKQYVKMKQSK